MDEIKFYQEKLNPEYEKDIPTIWHVLRKYVYMGYIWSNIDLNILVKKEAWDTPCLIFLADLEVQFRRKKAIEVLSG